MGLATKKELIKRQILEEHKCSGACGRCIRAHQLIDKMELSNIPVGYWLLNMKNFKGAPKLKEIVDQYIQNVRQKYIEGQSICLAGSQGTGKTMSATCILKAALKADFTAYYITAVDLLNEMVNSKTSHDLRVTLKDVDFLVIDELDSRFFVSDSVKELFSGIYENIFRFRAHNTLPTIMCSNETDGILSIFYGAGVQSIESLNSQYLTIYPVVGPDFRKQQGK
jgi:DNA replication protein DnaC